jgi:hypothetical protein
VIEGGHFAFFFPQNCSASLGAGLASLYKPKNILQNMQVEEISTND